MDRKPGKRVGRAASKKGRVTVDMYSNHLCGNTALGIIPINKDSLCKFGAIDIDEYPLNHRALGEKIEKLKLPLVMCRTKSGGAHLYMFLTIAVSAVLVQGRLREMASQLGYGGAEIFPRQTKLLVERGDVGQWINLPYFDGDRTDRYGFDNEGRKLDTSEFVKYVYSKQITENQLEAIQHFEIPNIIEGGPPCLQRLIEQGFPAGTRNNGLLNLGVYAKKVDPDNWETIIEELNSSHMDPPLTSVEVQGVIKSLNKREYQYTCNQQPIQAYCDKARCKMCKYGIGNFDIGMPKFGTLTKIGTEPPIWFLDVEGGERLELSTDELQNPIMFQRRCMATLNIMPGISKRDDWTMVVRRLMENVTIIEVPRDATPRGRLVMHLEEFCTGRVSAKNHEELILGRPWTDKGRHYFRMSDLMAYLDRRGFDELPKNYVALYIRELGSEHHFFNIKGKACNCWSIPQFVHQPDQPLDTPEQLKPSF